MAKGMNEVGKLSGRPPLNRDAQPAATPVAEPACTPAGAGAGQGTLYLVGTPIGNLGDLSARAGEVLARVDLIAAEDTRRTMRLCFHLGLRKHLESYHEHNRKSKGPLLMAQLRQGRDIALVSDAGMPGISDPGEDLVRSCIDEDIPVVVIPGPCAAINGLVASGLAGDRFAFDGFIPATGRLRQERIRQLNLEMRTTVLYEAPHRLVRTLADLAGGGLGNRRLTLARELTKMHEEYRRTTVDGALAHYREHEPRGEFVLVLEGLAECRKRLGQTVPELAVVADFALAAGLSMITEPTGSEEMAAIPATDVNAAARSGDGLVDLDEGGDQSLRLALSLIRNLLSQGVSCKDAARQAAQKTGRKKNELYRLALQIQEGEG
jgi:16S rRNA (cytidine1402-2'-O)-methyltransferase